MKYATFHLLMINVDKYIDGACISGYTYRKYGNKNIHNNIMVDENVTEKQKEKLQIYFDNVFVIPLIQYNSDFPMHTNKMKNRYSKWIQYATTKWIVLTFEQYDKVLFCDIDTLAVDDYTRVFSLKTPAWTCYHKSHMDSKKISEIMSNVVSGKEMKKDFIEKISGNTIHNICSYKPNKKYFPLPINASIVLLKPSKNTFNDLFSYVNKKIGIKLLSYFNGPDENVLFQYYVCHKKQPIYHIGLEYLTTEWRFNQKHISYKNVKKPIIMNYDSTEKPWLKTNKKDYYNEELIWYNLRKKITL